jgi:hypothetical protein
LSLDAAQARLIWDEEIAVAERPVGVEGAVVSGGGGGGGPVTVMVPPVPETTTALPFPKDPIVLPTAMGTDALLVGVSVTVTTAATPLAIVAEVKPDAKQIVAPVLLLHWIVLAAAVRTGPAATLTEVTLAAV